MSHLPMSSFSLLLENSPSFHWVECWQPSNEAKHGSLSALYFGLQVHEFHASQASLPSYLILVKNSDS